ncbi:hypothetical protein CTAYLR_002532 [Chrysophaeum taylorii]|uniref:Peptidase S9 prolyl oligopeptidase catalytic domain-containing protein n=1 Tax=Chrysophaeum taylorii TaxID=2483200 RepID=A0AAD7UF10_9STRA|nr:hypothetical protein CTAYLR_002532 [Chrysophaeum taylorii]
MRIAKPFGSWPSALTAAKVTEGVVGLSSVEACGRAVYWLEARPQEAGRQVVVRKVEGRVEEAIPKSANARTRVHEYGGGAWLPLDEATVLYSNFSDQRLWINENPLTGEPPEPGAWRYADFSRFGDAVYCVREEHGDGVVKNSVARVSLIDGSSETVAGGSDFYASPRVSPNGARLALVRWNHPNMPWDTTELVVLDLESGAETVVAGGTDESVAQPYWRGDDLYYLSDRSGWYGLYRYNGGGDSQAVFTVPADLGDAAPGWRLGQRGYCLDAAGVPIVAFKEDGRSRLARPGAKNNPEYIQVPCDVSGVRCGDDGALYFIGTSATAPPFVAKLESGGELEKLATAAEALVPADGVAKPELFEFETTGGAKAFAYLYMPQSAEYVGCDHEKPPLLVKAHGGPTACASSSYSNVVQFWTSRGFAVCDVDYRGSTGYGREYRKALRGNWGVYDVEDVCAAAKALVAKGLVDESRLAIDGGSAGGYTTLGALAWKDVFTAGCSLYGVADLAVLARDTHKFESRYLDTLVGPWPEARDLYSERAPINAVDRLNCPVILLQGAEDKIVPPNQAELMHAALEAKGVPTAIKIYDGEQHGFRKAENIVDALNSELYFYSRVFGFELPPDEDLVPFAIDNLDDAAAAT